MRPGVVAAGGESLAVLGSGAVVEHLTTWGDADASELLAAMIDSWDEEGRPGLERLHVTVSYPPGISPGDGASGDGALSFSWI